MWQAQALGSYALQFHELHNQLYSQFNDQSYYPPQYQSTPPPCGIVVEEKEEEEEQIEPFTIQDMLKDRLIRLTLGAMTFTPTIAPAFTPTSSLPIHDL